MKKFDEWNEVKKDTQKKNFIFSVKPREIYWVKIGQNIGSEEYGKGELFSRPVIVVRQLTSDLFIGIPTTTADKENNDYFHNINYIDIKKNNINSTAMIYQFKTFSKKRVTSKIGKLSVDEFEKIKVKMVNLLFSPAKSRT
jgi:mRNA interferase MazF